MQAVVIGSCGSGTNGVSLCLSLRRLPAKDLPHKPTLKSMQKKVHKCKEDTRAKKVSFNMGS